MESFNSLSIEDRIIEFKENKWINDLLEWTFLYDWASKKEWRPYNKTYFEDIWGVSYKDFKENKIGSIFLIENKTKSIVLIETVQKKLKWYIEELRLIQEELREWDNNNPNKTQIEIEWIESMITSIETAIPTGPFELEKAWGDIWLSKQERNDNIKEIEKWQEKLYWPKVSEVPEETSLTLNLICKEFTKNKKHLNEKERNEYVGFYKKLIAELKEWGYKEDIPDIENYLYKEPERDSFTKNILERFKNIEIPREDFMQILQLYIDAHGLWIKVVLDPNVSSIYDSQNELLIPENKSTETYRLDQTLFLKIHEVWTHYINQKITQNAWIQVRWAWNVEKDEWEAKINEGTFKWFKLEDLNVVSTSFPTSLMWEFLSEKDLQRFIDLRIKLNSVGWKKTWDIDKNRFLRCKRWLPFWYKWTQRKDLLYGRGQRKIVKALLDWKISIIDLYKWKFSLEDIESWKLEGVIKDEDIIFPIFFPDMLLFLMSNKKFTHKNFVNYLSKKYKWIIPEEYFEKIGIIKLSIKAKFIEIMELLPKNLLNEINENRRKNNKREIVNKRMATISDKFSILNQNQ